MTYTIRFHCMKPYGCHSGLLLSPLCKYLGEKRCVLVWLMKSTPVTSVNMRGDEINVLFLHCLSPDIDECATQMHYCQSNTVCVNLPGSHRCDCLPGFIRVDEYSCSGTSAPAVGRVSNPFRSFVAANELKVFFWSARVTSSLFKCPFNK